MSIRVEKISKLYGEQKALDNVSFEIETGQIVGFLGPNGAGKSTMMKIITGYLQPSDGNIFLNEAKVEGGELEVRSKIGYLPENNPLYLDMFVKEYLSFVANIYRLKNKRARIEEIIELTGLTKEQHKTIGLLSKGYRQRVGLAQALIHDPEVLILDEPTTGLDPNQLDEIRFLIQNISRDKTVMLSTHIMQEVEALCDRVVIVDSGKIIADETVDKLKHEGNSSYTIEVEFSGSVDETWTEEIVDVMVAKRIGNDHFLVSTRSDCRAQIFDWCVDNGITLLGMSLKSSDLESVFRRLTNRTKN